MGDTHASRPPFIWISWEVTRRSRGMSAALGARLHEITFKGGRLVRYWNSIKETLRILSEARGSLVFVQSPSIVLANLATLVARRYGVTVVVDAHNGGIAPLEGRVAWLRWLAESSLRRADLVIVTNDALAQVVRRLGSTPFVLPDPMPNWPADGTSQPAQATKEIVAICTWASDEPYMELIEAARQLPEGYRLSITGRPKLSEDARAALPPNVRLTGFIPEADYLSLLRGANVIVDLTTRENCLVCGAYEAISLHKALVVSDTAALRELLDCAAEYCTNDPAAIRAAILRAANGQSDLESAARTRDAALRTNWEKMSSELHSELIKIAITERTTA